MPESHPFVAEHIQQIAVLEEKVHRHEESIGSLDVSINKLTTEIKALKNIGVGIMLAILANEFGIVELLKSMFIK